MGKRQQSFEKRPRDYYATIDPDAVKPLIPFIRGLRVAEPCAGNGDLAMLLEPDVKVVIESDVEPQNKYVQKADALSYTEEELSRMGIDAFVTNPPFSWNLLQPLLDHLPTLRPTWLLLPADVMHNKHMGPYMNKCTEIVSVGRLYWMDNKVKGVDNFAWFLFSDDPLRKPYTTFHGRT